MSSKRVRTFVEVKSDLPPKWEPEPGEVLAGIYLGAKRLKLTGAKPFLTYQVQDEDTGEVTSFAGAIADRMMSRIPQHAFIQVTYLGLVKVASSRNEAKSFKIECEDGVELLPETYAQDAGEDDSDGQDERGVYRGGRVEREERASRTARNATRD